MKIREITPEIDMVFVDMDGVITYFDKGVADYNHITVQEVIDAGWDSKYWKKIQHDNVIEEFYENLDWQPGGKDLLNWLDDNDIKYSFLTKPVREPYTESTIIGKKEWLKRNKLNNIPCYFERHKEKYAKSENGINILIDDLEKNIKSWNNAGGIGILYDYHQYKDVIDKLNEICRNITRI